MARKVKLLFAIFAFCFLIFPASDASALEYVNFRPKVSDSIDFNSIHSFGSVIYNYPNVRIGMPLGVDSVGLRQQYYNRVADFKLFSGSNVTLKEGMVANFSITAETITVTDIGHSGSPIVNMDFFSSVGATFNCPSSSNEFIVESCSIQNSVTSDSFTHPQSTYQTSTSHYIQTSTMNITLRVAHDVNTNSVNLLGQWFSWYAPVLNSSSSHLQTLLTQFVAPSITFYQDSSSQIVGAINDQTKQDKDQFDQEQQQREEDKKASEDASNNSQTSSDDSQKQADDASKNLFQVLTEFVGAVSGASASSCSITGNFGFFNVGNIDLCTGASKVTPITTIVGTIMLIGLTIPAVVTLLHRFVSLYNEVMD